MKSKSYVVKSVAGLSRPAAVGGTADGRAQDEALADQPELAAMGLALAERGLGGDGRIGVHADGA
jgi:hypothetical protein